jgi:crotonobetainyl-CoA:carnitine CoA-transferase CaiB-like acyl-CoA transferase
VSYALEHLKVIDAASYLAGPAAATVFADYGARVTKIEPPQGDGYRLLVGPYRTPYHWQLTSRSKRSLALDYNNPEAAEVVARLVADADVLITNFRPDQLKRFSMGYEELAAINPRLVYGHITGYGSRGPDAHMRAFDTTAWWARSGMMDLVRDPGQTPQQGAAGFGDHSTAMTLFGAIMTALYQRERSGKGALVSTSLAANGIWANGMQIQGKIAGYDFNAARQEKGITNPFTYTYQTRDAHYLVLCIANPQREWPALARALGHDDWLVDERFANARMAFRNAAELMARVGQAFAALTLDQARQQLDKESVPYGLVHNLDDVMADEQLKANDIIIPTGSQDLDYAWTVNSPMHIEGSPKKPPEMAPGVGAQSREILRELGYDETEIDHLVTARTINDGQAAG